METSQTFNEKVKLFTEALQGETEEEIYSDSLDVILQVLDSVAGQGPYDTETIHALSLSLAKLPNKALINLAEELRIRIKRFSGELEDLVKRKLVHFDKKKVESVKIGPVVNIDHYHGPPLLFRPLARLEAVLHAVSWVHEPPSEEEQQSWRLWGV
jgi:hypothetical protein